MAHKLLHAFLQNSQLRGVIQDRQSFDDFCVLAVLDPRKNMLATFSGMESSVSQVDLFEVSAFLYFKFDRFEEQTSLMIESSVFLPEEEQEPQDSKHRLLFRELINKIVGDQRQTQIIEQYLRVFSNQKDKVDLYHLLGSQRKLLAMLERRRLVFLKDYRSQFFAHWQNCLRFYEGNKDREGAEALLGNLRRIVMGVTAGMRVQGLDFGSEAVLAHHLIEDSAAESFEQQILR